jgi:hypothetical protein
MVNMNMIVYWNVHMAPDCGTVDKLCIAMAVEGSGMVCLKAGGDDEWQENPQ